MAELENSSSFVAFTGPHLRVLRLPALSDNYIYIIIRDDRAAVVDPAVSKMVEDLLKRYKLKLEYILCTHHHFDHTGGNMALKEGTGCEVLGPEDKRITGLDRAVREGDKIYFGAVAFDVLSVPGHTITHIVYYSADEGILFSGDCLFEAGCGRIFEGTPEQMWGSLCRLRSLPGGTKIFPGHEYTLENLEFAASLEPENRAVQVRLESVRKMRKKNIPTVPALISEERVSNPFFRADDPLLGKAIGMESNTEIEIFAAVRKMKDRY